MTPIPLGIIAASSADGTKGFAIYTTSGTWVAPDGVNKVNVVTIGGGGGGASGTQGATGGAGGNLSYINNYSVTPGSSYPVVVGANGLAPIIDYGSGSAGGTSYFVSTSVVAAAGGSGGTATNVVAAVPDALPGQTYSQLGTLGGLGGISPGLPSLNGAAGSGGGGAAGYGANGGNGGRSFENEILPTAGSYGSGGGGGGGGYSDIAGSGAGVGIWGLDPLNPTLGGAAGVNSTVDALIAAGGVYGGSDGYVGGGVGGAKSNGGSFGGGGGGSDNSKEETGNGAQGVVAIFWGPSIPSFPNSMLDFYKDDYIPTDALVGFEDFSSGLGPDTLSVSGVDINVTYQAYSGPGWSSLNTLYPNLQPTNDYCVRLSMNDGPCGIQFSPTFTGPYLLNGEYYDYPFLKVTVFISHVKDGEKCYAALFLYDVGGSVISSMGSIEANPGLTSNAQAVSFYIPNTDASFAQLLFVNYANDIYINRIIFEYSEGLNL